MLGNKSVIRCAVQVAANPLRKLLFSSCSSLFPPFPSQLNCLLTVPGISLGYSEGALLGGTCRAAHTGFLAEIFSCDGEEETRQGSRNEQLSTQLCHISAALLAAVRGKGR